MLGGKPVQRKRLAPIANLPTAKAPAAKGAAAVTKGKTPPPGGAAHTAKRAAAPAGASVKRPAARAAKNPALWQHRLAWITAKRPVRLTLSRQAWMAASIPVLIWLLAFNIVETAQALWMKSRLCADMIPVCEAGTCVAHYTLAVPDQHTRNLLLHRELLLQKQCGRSNVMVFW